MRTSMNVSESVICESALQRFGIEKQMIKCVEELSELQKELCKLSLGQGILKNVIEEIADVEIMLEQMKIGLNVGFYELTETKSKKLHRLSERLNSFSGEKKVINDEEKEFQFEAKCKMCRYVKLTVEDLAKLGTDPCAMCRDLSNWKPKEVNGL